MAQVLRFSELSPVRQALVRIWQTAAALAFLAREAAAASFASDPPLVKASKTARASISLQSADHAEYDFVARGLNPSERLCRLESICNRNREPFRFQFQAFLRRRHWLMKLQVVMTNTAANLPVARECSKRESGGHPSPTWISRWSPAATPPKVTAQRTQPNSPLRSGLVIWTSPAGCRLGTGAVRRSPRKTWRHRLIVGKYNRRGVYGSNLHHLSAPEAHRDRPSTAQR